MNTMARVHQNWSVKTVNKQEDKEAKAFTNQEYPPLISFFEIQEWAKLGWATPIPRKRQRELSGYSNDSVKVEVKS